MATTSSKGGTGPSKSATDAMCMWETSSSTWRKEASCGLNRSGLIDPPLCVCPKAIEERGRRRPWASGRLWDDGRGRRLAERGQEGRGEDPPARLLVRDLDHMRP